MTGVADSPLALHADAVIDTSVEREACPLGLAPTASTTLTLALGDAVALCLLEARGFTADMFAATHPHGTLGRKLLVTIGDIMARGEDIPRAAATTTVRDALVAMSRGAMGFVNVLDAAGNLVGVYTDGDLRRTLDRDLDIRSTPLEAVMTRRFTAVRPEQLAVEAVELMERRHITAVPVVDATGALAGAVNMRMLLDAGVV